MLPSQSGSSRFRKASPLFGQIKTFRSMILKAWLLTLCNSFMLHHHVPQKLAVNWYLVLREVLSTTPNPTDTPSDTPRYKYRNHASSAFTSKRCFGSGQSPDDIEPAYLPGTGADPPPTTTSSNPPKDSRPATTPTTVERGSKRFSENFQAV